MNAAAGLGLGSMLRERLRAFHRPAEPAPVVSKPQVFAKRAGATIALDDLEGHLARQLIGIGVSPDHAHAAATKTAAVVTVEREKQATAQRTLSEQQAKAFGYGTPRDLAQYNKTIPFDRLGEFVEKSMLDAGLSKSLAKAQAAEAVQATEDAFVKRALEDLGAQCAAPYELSIRKAVQAELRHASVSAAATARISDAPAPQKTITTVIYRPAPAHAST